MGNNNTSDIKEEDNTGEAEKKSHLDNLHEDSLKKEDQINRTATSECADTKTAEMVSADTNEPEGEISQEDTHEDRVKEENQDIPTSDANIVLENAAKASHDTATFELGNDAPPEDIQTDDLKEKIQTVPTAEGKDVEEKAALPASGHIESMSENDPFKGDTHKGDANMESQKQPTAEDDDVQEKTTGLASDHTRSEHERDSLEGDTCKEDVNVDENPTPEGTDAEEMDARLALHEETSDPKKDLSQEDTHDNDKDESALILFGGREYVPEKSTILDSDDAVNLRDTYEQEIIEIRQPEESPNAESVEDRGVKCEILPSSSLESTENFGKQTASSLRKNLLVTDHHHLDSEPTQEEEEDTKVTTLDALDMSNEAELQESPVVNSNHKELVKVLSESSWPKGYLLDTNSLYSQDDDATERETQTQNNISSDKSEASDRDETESSLGDLSITESDSSSGIKSVNYITEDSLNPLSEAVNVTNPSMHDSEENNKVLHEERKLSRSGSTKENSYDQNPGECLQEPLNELKACIVNTNDMTIVSNGDCDGERNEVERPEATENGHHFDSCDDNINMTSDDTSTLSEQKHLVVPEAEMVSHSAVSTVVDCTEEEREGYKKEIEEIYNNQDDSRATENGFEGREMLAEQCNSHLVTTEHAESFTLQSFDSLLHIYSYQENNENQTKTLTATSMETSDWKQENHDEALEKELEDYYSQDVEPTSTNSLSENGGYYETRESTIRLSTESNPDSVTISFHIQKSPSFNLNLQNGESPEESDQSPLLSHQTSLHIMDSWPQSENGHCSLEHEEMPVEEKIVTMERSYMEKSYKAPLLCHSREDDETSLLVSSSLEQGNHAGTYNAVKEETSTSPKQKEKRKSTVSSFFINCMCCATVAN